MNTAGVSCIIRIGRPLVFEIWVMGGGTGGNSIRRDMAVSFIRGTCGIGCGTGGSILVN